MSESRGRYLKASRGDAALNVCALSVLRTLVYGILSFSVSYGKKKAKKT